MRYKGPMNPHSSISLPQLEELGRTTPADGRSYGTGLSWGAVQKIQELKRLINKYPQYCPDGIIGLAIYNSINGDDSLLDDKLEQLRRLDSLANIKF